MRIRMQDELRCSRPRGAGEPCQNGGNKSDGCDVGSSSDGSNSGDCTNGAGEPGRRRAFDWRCPGVR